MGDMGDMMLSQDAVTGCCRRIKRLHLNSRLELAILVFMYKPFNVPYFRVSALEMCFGTIGYWEDCGDDE